MSERLYHPARSERNAEVGMVWEEVVTNNVGSFECPKYATIRVRATGATTVTIDGTLAATMSSGEIMLFNVGQGTPNDAKRTVTVAIAVANAFVQISRMTEITDNLLPK